MFCDDISDGGDDRAGGCPDRDRLAHAGTGGTCDASCRSATGGPEHAGVLLWGEISAACDKERRGRQQ